MRQESLLVASGFCASLKVGHGFLIRSMLKHHAIAPEALMSIKSCVEKGYTYLTTNSVLVFACGARPNDSVPGGRDRIMDYAKKHLKKYNFFNAEKFFDLFQDGEGKDLLSLEDQLAEYSDCIIIVLESESAFSELGAFAIKDDLANQIRSNTFCFAGSNGMV